MEQTSPSEPSTPGSTITDKLCRLAFSRLSDRAAAEYEKLFPHRQSTDDFFAYLERWDAKVSEDLRKRPLTRSEVQIIEEKAFKAIRAKMHGSQVEQPRMQEAVDITTGKVRLIPRERDA